MPDETSWRYRGWRVVATCFLMATFSWGIGFYSQGVFLAELQRAHGWPAGVITGAITEVYLLGALFAAFVGDAVTRLGPRCVLLFGLLALGVSVAALPFVAAPWQLYAAYVLMAAGWSTTSLAAIVVTLGLWFDARRGMAISMALNGASVGGMVMAPTIVGLAARIGFQGAVLSVVAAMLVVLVPLVGTWVGHPAYFRAAAARPVRAGCMAPAGWSKGQLLRLASFWSVAAPFGLGIAAQVGFIVLQVVVLQPAIGRGAASVAVAITAAFALVGRVALSPFIDWLDHRRATAVLLVNQGVALGMISVTANPTLLFVASAAFGVTVGNLITLPALIIQREFPAGAFAQVSSLVTSMMGFTYALAPAALGVLHDATGGYTVPLSLCIAAEVLAAMLVVLRPRSFPAAR